MADAEGVSKSTVQRSLKPHLSDTFLSSDPFFIEKVRDVTGLYLNPPDNAMVLCVDEKSRYRPSIARAADGTGLCRRLYP